MDVKKLMLLLGALVMAGVSAFMAKSLFTGAGAPEAAAAPPVPLGPEVMVAIRDLPVGTIITPDMVRYTPWPKDLVETAYFIRGQGDIKDLVGTVVRYPVTAGQPLTQGSLVKPGDRGFLAAALGPGMRAVTVPVSAQSSVAGFVFPGDRVDLVLTQQVNGGGNGEPLKVAETIVRNIRVLATDQKTDKTSNEQGQTVVTAYSTVTLEATPKLAEKISVAQTIGQLALSLRPLADDATELAHAVANGTAATPAGTDPAAAAKQQALIQVASRPIDTATTFTVGADVSRFQRRSVPAAKEGPNYASNGMTPPKPTGPVIHVARGNTVTDVPLGGK